MSQPRIAARAVILHDNRLLLVNAYRNPASSLWCAPGGGVVAGHSLPDNLIREVHEETGLTIAVGAPCLVNEFHDPIRGFHQVEVFFRARITDGALCDSWTDPEGIVTRRGFFTQAEAQGLRLKPDSLPHVAWARGFGYDPLERIVPA
jgi:8-oxo-dGTP diphosphatase